MKTVFIKLHFGKGSEGKNAEIETNGVPATLILDSLKTIMKIFSVQIVEEAQETVPDSDIEKYIEARLKVDRKKEADL